jgi:serine/threonine protein kinase
MEQTTFLEHYRISVSRDGTPHELGRAGAAISYTAVDNRSGERVALKLIPIANLDEEVQKQFEEQARPAQQLHHVNIARVLDFGKEAGQFVYVSEYLEGETVDSWIEEHGPMPPDSVLRVAAQVVSALSAASFHRLTHRAIQPSNLLIVPGPTPEGGWPFIKLIDVSSAGSKLHSHEGEAPTADSAAARQFASPEQLQDGRVDFRSAIFSLGATMYFLLTGAAPPAKVRLRELRRFPKALRNLLAHMLRSNPDERPQDLAALEKEILKCLTKVEKRHAFGRRLGIPLAAVTPKEPKTPPTPLVQVLRGTLVVAALLLAMGVAGAFLLPDDLNPFRHRTAAKQMIGVPIGVPNPSPSPSAQATNTAPIAGNQAIANVSPASQNPPPNILQDQTSNSQSIGAATPPNAPNANPNASTQTGLASKRTRTGQSFLDQRNAQLPRGRIGVSNPSPSPSAQATNAAPIAGNQAIANASPASQNPPPNILQDQTSNSQSVGAATSPNAPNANPNASTQADTSGQEQATSSAQANVAPQPGTASDSTSPTQKEKAAGLASNRARTGQSFLDQRNPQLPPGRGRSGRARVVGITSDGKLIFRLPSGRRMIVAPDSNGEGELVPQGHRRSYMERGQPGPQPQFGEGYPPND